MSAIGLTGWFYSLMKTVKKTLRICIDIYPLDHPSHRPVVGVYNADMGIPEPTGGQQRKTLEVEIDVPVKYDELPTEAVKSIT